MRDRYFWPVSPSENETLMVMLRQPADTRPTAMC
jgi:hypothetical protein